MTQQQQAEAPLAVPKPEIEYYAEDLAAPPDPAYNSHTLPNEEGKLVSMRFSAGKARKVCKAAMEKLVGANQRAGVQCFRITMNAPDGEEFNPSNVEALDLMGMIDAITLENRQRGERLAGLIGDELEKLTARAREEAVADSMPPGHVIAALEDLTIDALMRLVAKYPNGEHLNRNSGKPVLTAFILDHQKELAQKRAANAGAAATENIETRATPA